jgi:hypothetical protein
LETYLGTNINNDTVLNKAILRASETVDVLTHYALQDDRLPDYVPFDSQPTFVQGQIQKAVATLVEHWIIKGGYDAVKLDEGLQEGYIGEFRFMQSSESGGVENIPETVIAMLSTTGLLHNQIHLSRNDGLYYNGIWL